MGQVYFDAEEDAAELIGALEAESYQVSLGREGFAGEDDSDDRAWVLRIQPWDERVTEMVDVYGGWLPGDERPRAKPVDLPNQPRRITSSEAE